VAPVSSSPPEVRVRRLSAGDGLELALHCVGPEGGAPVLCVHGTFSNHRYWLGTRGSGFARELAGHGFEAWVLDLRGHGDSAMPRRGQPADFDAWARLDLAAGLRAALDAADRRGTPGFAVGHSAGGATLLMALAAEPDLRERLDGLVLAGTPLPWTQGFRRTGARLVRLATWLMPRFPARLLGLGPEDELNGVMRQWMGWNLRGRMTGHDGLDYGAALPSVRVPTLAVAGAADRLFAPPASCQALLERLGGPDRTFLLAGRENGFDTDYGHADLIASPHARVELWPRLIEWLEARRAH